MSTRSVDIHRLLRWYPRRWRERYGDEFVVMMGEGLGDRRPSLRYRASVVAAGLREHGHEGGLLGSSKAPSERIRTASLLVLCAWTAFVVPGAAFAKIAEHFEGALPVHRRALPISAFDIVRGAAIFGGALVVIGAAAVVPALAKLLHQGGWQPLRGHILRALVASALAGAATIGLVSWAHSLSTAERNGGSWAYGLAFVGWALLVAVSLALWTTTAVMAGRRVQLSRRIALFEGMLGVLVTLAMLVMTVGTAAWWGTLAFSAPWFLHETQVELGGSPFEARLAMTMLVMTTAAALGGIGSVRIIRSVRELARPAQPMG
jgi:hypothetical protein